MRNCTIVLALLAALLALAVLQPARAATFYWDGSTPPYPNGASDGGDGTWQVGVQHWEAGPPINWYAPWADGNDAVFAGLGGTVTVRQTVTPTSISVDTTGGNYRLQSQWGWFDGVLGGSGGLTKTGSGELDLSGAGGAFKVSFTGGTIDLQQGNIIHGWGGSVDYSANKASLKVNSGADFNLYDMSDATVDALLDGSSGGGTVRKQYYSGDLTVGVNNGSGAFSGTIESAGLSLTKTGTGVQTLSGDNSYGGATNVNQGTLVIDGNQSAATGAVTVASGATLGGDGTIGGTVTVQSGGNLTVDGGDSLSIAKAITVESSGAVTINGTLQSDVALTVESGGTLTVSGTGTLQATGFIHGTLAGTGTLQANGDLTIGTYATPFDFDGGSLNVSDYRVGLTDPEVVQLPSGGTTIGGGILSSYHGMELGGGYTLSSEDGTVDGNFTNNGTVTGTGGIPEDKFKFTGVVDGTGAFDGNVEFTGLYSPGLSAAQVTLGSPTFSNTLLLELGGLVAGDDFDQLLITGTATLTDCTLLIDLIDSFNPSAGDSFLVIDGGTLVGPFAHYSLPGLDPGLDWVVDQTSESVTLTVVPEPSTLVLLGTGLLALLLFARRRKK